VSFERIRKNFAAVRANGQQRVGLTGSLDALVRSLNTRQSLNRQSEIDVKSAYDPTLLSSNLFGDRQSPPLRGRNLQEEGGDCGASASQD